MPVRKFSAPPEHDDTLWMDPRGPGLVRTIAAVWDTARRLCPSHFPPGVYKHASIESANRMTEGWESAALKRASAPKE